MKVECVSCGWTGQLADTDSITIADQEDVPACPACGDPVSVAFERDDSTVTVAQEKP